jgi:hypothetical protein
MKVEGGLFGKRKGPIKKENRGPETVTGVNMIKVH